MILNCLYHCVVVASMMVLMTIIMTDRIEYGERVVACLTSLTCVLCGCVQFFVNEKNCK